MAPGGEAAPEMAETGQSQVPRHSDSVDVAPESGPVRASASLGRALL